MLEAKAFYGIHVTLLSDCRESLPSALFPKSRFVVLLEEHKGAVPCVVGNIGTTLGML